MSETQTISAKVALGAGCYWGTEKFIKEDFQEKFPNSIKNAEVGFMSPIPNNPSRSSSKVQNGFVQVLKVELHQPQKHFEELIKFFFMFHDPTLIKQQGEHCGFQYSSYIFCGDREQIRIAAEVKEELQDFINMGRITTGSSHSCYRNCRVQTKICPATKFYPAPVAHRDGLTNIPRADWRYLNSSHHYLRMSTWPDEYEYKQKPCKLVRCLSPLVTEPSAAAILG